MSTEITSDEEAQQALTEVIGDIDDVEGLIDDVNYTKALEDLDDMLEKLSSVRVYLKKKAEE